MICRRNGVSLTGAAHLGSALALILCAACSSGSSPPSGPGQGRLAPCPETPNCVSTQGHHARRTMAPLPFKGTLEESRRRVLGLVGRMKGASVVMEREDYIHATFTTRLFRFVDDAEFLFDARARLIHFRCASRTGYYDFGVNRRRMERISRAYLGEGGTAAPQTGR